MSKKILKGGEKSWHFAGGGIIEVGIMQNNKKGPREGSMKARSGFRGQGKARDLPALGEKPKALRGETKPKS